MKACNEQAGAKKMEGEARKKFMSACLKGRGREDDPAAGAHEGLQQAGVRQEDEGRRPQAVHERLPQGRLKPEAGLPRAFENDVAALHRGVEGVERRLLAVPHRLELLVDDAADVPQAAEADAA